MRMRDVSGRWSWKTYDKSERAWVRALKRGWARNTKKMWRKNSGMGAGQATYERERAPALPNNTKFFCGPKDEDDNLAMI